MSVYQLEFVAVFCVFRKPCFVESGGRRLRRRRRERLFESKAAGETKAAPGGRVKFMVPGAGFEPAHLSATVFETVVSAVPPPGRECIYAV